MWIWPVTSTVLVAVAAPMVLQECSVHIPGLPPLIISKDDERPPPNTVEPCDPTHHKKFGCRWELWCEDGSPVYARCPETGERRFIREHPVHPDDHPSKEFIWQCPGPLDLNESNSTRLARLGVRSTDEYPLGWSLNSDVEGWMRGEIIAPWPGHIDQLWAMRPPESMCASGQELILDDGQRVVHTVLEGPPEACRKWIETWNLSWHADSRSTATPINP